MSSASLTRYLPHAREQLDQTTVSESQCHHDIGLCQTPRAHVDQTQHESGQGESAEAEGRGIGKFAALDGLVSTGLELPPKGGQTPGFVGWDMGKRTIAKASSLLGRFVLLRAHVVRGCGSAIGVLVEGVTGRMAGRLMLLIVLIVALGRLDVRHGGDVEIFLIR